MESDAIDLCASGDLVDSALAVPFDVVYQGQTCRAFAIRYQGQVHAYLNVYPVWLGCDAPPSNTTPLHLYHQIVQQHGTTNGKPNGLTQRGKRQFGAFAARRAGRIGSVRTCQDRQ